MLGGRGCMACFLSGCLRRGWSQGPVCTFGPRWILARSATVNTACFMSPAVLIFPAPSLIPLPYNIRSSKKKRTRSHSERLLLESLPCGLLYGEVRFQGGAAVFFFLFLFLSSKSGPPASIHQSLNGHATPVTAAALKTRAGPRA